VTVVFETPSNGAGRRMVETVVVLEVTAEREADSVLFAER
jgi:hypothetical protein